MRKELRGPIFMALPIIEIFFLKKIIRNNTFCIKKRLQKVEMRVSHQAKMTTKEPPDYRDRKDFGD